MARGERNPEEIGVIDAGARVRLRFDRRKKKGRPLTCGPDTSASPGVGFVRQRKRGKGEGREAGRARGLARPRARGAGVGVGRALGRLGGSLAGPSWEFVFSFSFSFIPFLLFQIHFKKSL